MDVRFEDAIKDPSPNHVNLDRFDVIIYWGLCIYRPLPTRLCDAPRSRYLHVLEKQSIP